jgi:hypothetical protein
MSLSARRYSPANGSLCTCGRRCVYWRPRARSLAARRDHPLCLRCWHAEFDRERARQFALLRRAIRVDFVPSFLVAA